ncbi:MAG: DUF4129 domain-containing protein [Rhodoferax sp.]|nr:DUF4129 domain-containing protein [Rhodoferax sp.]
MKTDPDLGGSHKEKTLRFKKTDEEKKPELDESGVPQWLRSLFEWIARSARTLVWVLGALALALVLVSLRRWVRVRAPWQAEPPLVLPTHVRTLDIRPESLPADIGAAAAELWHQGAHLPALSLLYRGTLSRLVHVHAVQIRAASTEDECVALAQERLVKEPGDFVAALVAAWQLAVYGARLPEDQRVLGLCRDFDMHFALTPTSATGDSSEFALRSLLS